MRVPEHAFVNWKVTKHLMKVLSLWVGRANKAVLHFYFLRTCIQTSRPNMAKDVHMNPYFITLIQNMHYVYVFQIKIEKIQMHPNMRP